jgi:multidrug resistance efflux pump
MRLSVVRILRLSVGGVILGAALSVVVFEHMAGASAGAVINARIATLQAPIGGELSLSGHTLGARVTRGEALATVAHHRSDTTRLEDLRMRRDALTARKARLAEEMAGVEKALATLADRAHRYGSQRVRQLEAELRSASARLAAARARLDQARAEHKRAKRLHARGFEPSSHLEGKQADTRVATRAVDERAAAVAAMKTALAAARDGVFLGDGLNDVPFSEQEAGRLSLRRDTLAAERAEVAGRLAAVDERIDAERRRLAAMRHATLRANVDGAVWEMLALDGEHVHASQDVMRLLDCGSLMVTASVTESVYNDLRIGDAAWFRVNGTNEILEGTVARLAGEGAASVYRNLAVAPTDEHLKRFDVKLHVPALSGHPALGCAVGRTGRVFFTERPLDWARRTVADARQ